MYLDTGFANKRRLMDMKCLIHKHGELMCSTKLALCAFSGCDSNSALIGEGKSTARKTSVKHPVFFNVFGTLGKTDGVPEGSHAELERCVRCMYGNRSYKVVCLRMPLTLTVTTMRRTHVWPAYWKSFTMTEMMILKTTQLH